MNQYNIPLLVFVLTTLTATTSWADCIGNKGSQRLLPSGTRYTIEATCFTDKGWYPPVPTNSALLTTSTNFDYESLVYSSNNNVPWTHGGIDLSGPLGADAYTTATPVYAISNGRVSYINRLAAATNNLSVIVVEHESGSGQRFSALYGHTFADASISVDQYIVRGQQIGTLRVYGTPIHLHLSIYPDYTWPSTRPGFGTNVGTREPMQFLRDNYASLIPRSTLDGTGSLIDTRNGGFCAQAPLNYFGCSRDDVLLHPHPLPSSGSFQIHSGVGFGCDYARLSGLTRGFVSVKKWNEAYPGASGGTDTKKTTVYYAAQLPVDLPLPLGFSIVSIATIQPIPVGETRSVRLECRTGTPELAAGRSEIAPELATRATNPEPLLFHLSGAVNRYFGGNGSLIEPSGNDNTLPFGRIQDYAKTLSYGLTENIFQIYRTEACSRVSISTNTGSATAQISSKAWRSADWTEHGNLPLPQAMNIPANSYYLLRVRPDRAASGRVSVQCQ